MSLRFRFFVTTLVLVLMVGLLLQPMRAFAAPTDLPPSDEPVIESQNEVEESVKSKRSKLETMQISDVPKPKPKKKDEKETYFYKYKQAINTRLGLYLDLEKLQNLEVPNYIIGLGYSFPSDTNAHWEIGADVVSDSTGRLMFDRKWVLWNKKSFRPFAKTGISTNLLAKDGIGGFLRWEQYELHLAAGFEDVIKDPMSVRLEFEVFVGPNILMPQFTFGYTWGIP